MLPLQMQANYRLCSAYETNSAILVTSVVDLSKISVLTSKCFQLMANISAVTNVKKKLLRSFKKFCFHSDDDNRPLKGEEIH